MPGLAAVCCYIAQHSNHHCAPGSQRCTSVCQLPSASQSLAPLRPFPPLSFAP